MADLGQADLIWVLGDDPFEIAPVAGVELRRLAAAGVPLVVFGSRAARLDPVAHSVLRLSPEGLTNLLKSLTAVVRKPKGADLSELGLRLGIKPSVLMAVLNQLRQAKRPVLVCDEGLPAGLLEAIFGLLTAVGRGDRSLWLRRATNSLGRSWMGLRPGTLPGGSRSSDKQARGKVERLWNDPLPRGTISSRDEVMAALRKGQIGAVLVINTDPCGIPLQAEDLHPGLFQVVFDLVPGPLADRAAVLLPASALAETGGTLVTNDGWVLPTAAVRRPVGGKTLFQALGALADALGQSFPLAKPEQVWAEMDRLQKGLAEFSAAKLDLAGQPWPC